MKPFLRDILFTFLLCLSLIGILEIAIGKTMTTRSYKDWYMTEHADKIKILLLGNSLFENSFDPHVFGDSVFDGASDARSLWYDVQILKKYAPNMSHLTTVIIPLVASAYADPPSQPFFQYFYARFMGIPVGKNPWQYSSLLSGHFTFHDLTPVTVSECVNDRKDYLHDWYLDSLGYSPLYHVWNGYLRTVDIPTSEEARCNRPVYLNCIADIAQYCEAHGVRLICIMPPVADIYLESIDSQIINALDSCLCQLSKSHNLEYRFYHNDPSFRADSLYADELHLNYQGASLFARRVKEDFKLKNSR